jgi:hypothetical protein
MGTFIPPATVPSTTPAPSPTAVQVVQKAQYVAANARNMVRRTLLPAAIAGWNAVWNAPNPTVNTPQAVVAAMGTGAADAFAKQVALIAFCSAVLPELLGTREFPTQITAMPTGWTRTANSDGSVTLTPPAQS